LKQKEKKVRARGPVARKLINKTSQHIKSAVVDLNAWKIGNSMADHYQAQVADRERLADYDPLQALFITAQHQLSILVEQISQLPMLDKVSETISAIEFDYAPSFPPESPLTSSYFTCWSMFDYTFSGAKKESLASVAIDLSISLNVETDLIAIYESMLNSRMGIYVHEGESNGFILLREMITDKLYKVVSGTGYLGRKGEVWYVRLLSSPLLDEVIDYSITFTTPYILGSLSFSNGHEPFTEKEWRAYFQRVLPRLNKANTIVAYEQLMKYGLVTNYWNEYIFLAYVNYETDRIFLEGIPDMPATLPHAELDRILTSLVTGIGGD